MRRRAKLAFEGRFESLRSFHSVLACQPPPPLGAPDRLRLAIQMSFGWLRWEPFGFYPLHGGRPSPRGIFICDLRIAIPSADGTREELYRYHPDCHALEWETTLTDDARICANGRVTFVIGAVIERIAPLYGDLSVHLATLECGHAAAQLAFMCHAVGWAARIGGTVHASVAWQSAYWRGRPYLPLSVVSTDAPADDLAQWIVGCPERTFAFVEHCCDLDRFDGLSVFLQAWNRPLAAAGPLRAALPAPVADQAGGDWSTEDVLAIVRRRSSGPDFTGEQQVGPGLTQAKKARFFSTLARLNAFIASDDLEGLDWALHLLSLRVDGENPYRARLGMDAGIVLPREDCDLTARFAECLGPGGDTRVKGLYCAFVFTVDLFGVLRRAGADGIVAVNIAAGRVSQSICLAAAAAGLCARPVRGFEDWMLERLLADGRTPAYLVLLSEGRDAVMDFDTDWACRP
ncbi:MAG TPA: hypothetical protein VGC36_02310 [Rhizomicrobium sp.]